MQKIAFFEDFKNQVAEFEGFQENFLAKSIETSPKPANISKIELGKIQNSVCIDDNQNIFKESPTLNPFSLNKLESKTNEVFLQDFSVVSPSRDNESSAIKKSAFYSDNKELNENNFQNLAKPTDDQIFPYIQKFLAKLKNASSFRMIEKSKILNFSILNDPVNFLDDNHQKSKNLNLPFFCKYFNKLKFGKVLKIFLAKLWENHQLVFHPYGNFRIAWDFIHLILIIFWFFYIPMTLVFWEMNQIQFGFHTVVFLCFDLPIKLNTSFFKNGILEISRNTIAKNYLRDSFIIDILTLISLCLYVIDPPVIHAYHNWHIDKFLNFIFYLKIITLRNILNRLLEKLLLKEKFQNILSLFKVIFISIFVAHIFACFWCSAANFADPSEQTWILKMGLAHSPWNEKYLYAIYWALVTMLTVGYGDITPQNNKEIIVCVISVVLGCVVYAFNISTIGIILQDLNKENAEFKHHINVINGFMKRKNINGDLQMRVREYLRFIWKEEKTQNIEKEQKIIDSLSKSLKEELMLQAYGEILKKHPMFYLNFSEKSLRKVVSIIKDIRLFPDEPLFSENEESNSLYFVMKGRIQMFLAGSKNSCVALKTIKVGENFGEVEFFTGKTRMASAKSKDFTTLFSINRDEFIQILKNNPEDFEKFCMIKDQIELYNNYNPLKIRCFCCDEIGHLAKDCNYIHFKPDHEKIIKTHVFYSDQQRTRFYPRKNHKLSAFKEMKLLTETSKKIWEVSNKEKETQKKYRSLFESLPSEDDSNEIIEREKSNEQIIMESAKKIPIIEEEKYDGSLQLELNVPEANTEYSDPNMKHFKSEIELIMPPNHIIKKNMHEDCIPKQKSKAIFDSSKNMNEIDEHIFKGKLIARTTFHEKTNNSVNSSHSLPETYDHHQIRNFDNKFMDYFERVKISKSYFPEGNSNLVIDVFNKRNYAKSLKKRRSHKKSLETRMRLSKYTFFMEELKSRMSSIIKKKKFKNFEGRRDGIVDLRLGTSGKKKLHETIIKLSKKFGDTVRTAMMSSQKIRTKLTKKTKNIR